MTMTLVSTVTVGSGGAASIDFTSIPQTGTDLFLVLQTRGSSTPLYTQIQFNADTGSNYTRMILEGTGSSAASFSATSTALFAWNATSAYTANTFSSTSIYIPNYTASTSKSISIESVNENNASTGYQAIEAGLWTGTSAISSIKIFTASSNYVQYSTASLYTITKGSGGATVS